MRIQHNIMAMNAYRNYTNNTSALAKNLEKLSSGYRINRAGDDAAGLAISEKMRAQITALGTAQKNVKDGISLVKTAEGATQEIHDMLNRMVDLATQSANGTYQNEVDREAIQDEFNALKTEINRIADSSNFNGIKLLDGSLGLNGDAFTIGLGDTYAEATAGPDATNQLTFAASNAGSTAYHLGTENVAFSAPKFSIDLSGMKVDLGSGTKDNITVTIGTTAITLSNCTATSATGIADAIRAAYTGSASTKVVSFGSGSNAIHFKAGGSGAKVTFEYLGEGKASAVASLDASAISSTAVGNFNDAIGAGVTVDASATGTTLTDPSLHDVIDVAMPVSEVVGKRAGIDVDISKVVQDGYTLTVDDKTFVFKTSATSDVTAGAGQELIDVSGFASGDQVQAAVDMLSNKTTANFRIEAVDGTNIHIDQLDSSTKVYDTDAKLKAVFKANAAGDPATVASTKLTVDESKLQKGNVITVGDKSFVYKGDGSNAFTSAAELATKLTAAGYKTTTSEVDGKTVLNIEGKRTNVDGKAINAEKVTAPTVVGKGLTLQIGEDSEAYNQLSVAIQDMHCDALGLTSNVTLANQEGAQKAVDVIKNAINQVSSTRGKLGATQNRLEHTANNLSTMKENIQDAEATIRDTDIAEEMMAYTKNNILVQSAQAMLAQANQIPQGVLQLLG